MIKEIVKDPMFLSMKSEPATMMDNQVVLDMIDTLTAHKNECVGMAANMIGVRKNIIVVDNEGVLMVMFNPVITEKSGPYETEEGCLSHTGTKRTTRYEKIKVSYMNRMFMPCTGEFEGFTAQIIQHEIDHLNGVLI